MINTLNYIKGYVLIEVSSVFPERFINIVINKNIYVWNVKRTSDASIRLCVSEKGYKKIEEIFGKNNVKVIYHKGLSHLFFRYKKRKAFIFGPLIFLLLLTASNMILWKVDIKGGDEILREKVREELKEIGVKPFAVKFNIKGSKVQKRCLTDIDEISWMWVNVRGTTAYVEIEPRTMPPEIEKEGSPCDIVAKYDGVITKIIAREGVACVVTGDAVQKGQILISGTIESEREDVDSRFVESKGEVRAMVNHQKTLKISNKKEIKTETGRKKDIFYINFYNFRIKLSYNSSIFYTQYDKITNEKRFPFFNIGFIKETYKEIEKSYTDKEMNIAKEEAINIFKEELEKEERKINNITADIKSDEYEIFVNAECEERIDEVKEIESFGENL